MSINTILKQKNMTKYKLSILSGVPHTTVLDICSGRAKINKCSVETLYKLAKALDVSMEDLIADSLINRPYFENFKSAICHKVKRLGEYGFIEEVLLSDEIMKLYKREWFAESFYLLAMVDYLSRENNIPLAIEYNNLRKARLKETVYPAGTLVLSAFCGDDSYKEMSVSEAIPEFKRHNIIESEIRNVF